MKYLMIYGRTLMIYNIKTIEKINCFVFTEVSDKIYKEENRLYSTGIEPVS